MKARLIPGLKSATVGSARKKGFRYQPLTLVRQYQTGAALLSWGDKPSDAHVFGPDEFVLEVD